jgi:hypothetical protein
MARRRAQGVPVTRYAAGPYVGQRDLNDPTARTSTLAQGMVNCYVRDPERATAVVGRPGYTTTEGGRQLGSSGARTVQAIGEFQRLGGQRYQFAVVGGKLYTYDQGADEWTERAFASGATLSSAAPQVGWVVLANQLVLSDGVNTPCAWSGSGWTVLSNCPVLLGRPWVHAGRLWGIKASDAGATIVWSEPNQLNTGYESTSGLITYRNAWTLGQTNQDAIVAGVGLNDRLVLFRRFSTTAVYGLVDENFSTGASRDTVSETVGCGAPFAVDVVDGTLFWVSADGWTYCLPPGVGDPIGIGEEVAETMASVNIAAVSACVAVFDRATDLWLTSLPVGGQTIAEQVYPVHTVNLKPQGVWTAWGSVTAIGTYRDAAGNTCIVHGGTDGRVYRHGHPLGNLWNDVSAAATSAIYHAIKTEPLGWNVSTDQLWERVDLAFRARSKITALTLQAYGPYGFGPAQTAAATTGNAQWDSAEWDNAQWATEGLDQHAAFGFECFGRWQQFEVRHAQLNEQFGFLTLEAWARVIAADPVNR